MMTDADYCAQHAAVPFHDLDAQVARIKGDADGLLFKAWYGPSYELYFRKPDEVKFGEINAEAFPVADSGMTLQSLVDRGILVTGLPTDNHGRVCWNRTQSHQRDMCHKNLYKVLPPFKSELSFWILREARRRGFGMFDYVHPSMIQYVWTGPYHRSEIPYGVIGHTLPSDDYIQKMCGETAVPIAAMNGSFEYAVCYIKALGKDRNGFLAHQWYHDRHVPHDLCAHWKLGKPHKELFQYITEYTPKYCAMM